MATQAEIITDVRVRLDEVSASFWDDSDIRRWINQGLRDVARRCEVLQGSTTVAAVAGTQTYALPTDAIRIYRVEFSPDGDDGVHELQYEDYNNADALWGRYKTITQADPYIYTMWGFPPSLNMTVYPTPSQAGTFTVYYYKLPTELAVTTTDDEDTEVDLPAGWEDVIVSYVEYHALRKDRNPAWQEAKALYEESLTHLYELTRRWTDQAGHMSPGLQFGGLPGWLVNEGWY